jgi:ATP-dependent helicase HrpA
VGRAGGPAFDEARWMLEELRVGLFAQTIRTPYRVSEERVRRVLDELDRAV